MKHIILSAILAVSAGVASATITEFVCTDTTLHTSKKTYKIHGDEIKRLNESRTDTNIGTSNISIYHNDGTVYGVSTPLGNTMNLKHNKRNLFAHNHAKSQYTYYGRTRFHTGGEDNYNLHLKQNTTELYVGSPKEIVSKKNEEDWLGNPIKIIEVKSTQHIYSSCILSNNSESHMMTPEAPSGKL